MHTSLGYGSAFHLISFLFQDLNLSPLNFSILSRYASELEMYALG